MDPSNASIQRWSSVTRNMSEFAATTLQGLFTVRGYVFLNLMSGIVTEAVSVNTGSLNTFTAQFVLDPGDVGGSLTVLSSTTPTSLSLMLPTAGSSFSLNGVGSPIVVSAATSPYVSVGPDRGVLLSDGVVGLYPTTITFGSGGTTITGGKVRWSALWQPLSGGASMTPYVS